MSLCKLPDTGYTYLSIESEGCKFIGENMDCPRSAQFWVNVELDQERYVPAIWWKFWKPTITFKVFACGGTVDPFYKTVRLQEK
jgi:hypothetical protein